MDIIDGLHVPSIVVAHTVLKDPTPHQRSVLEAITARADQVIVMSEAANQRLEDRFRRRPLQSHHDPARRDLPRNAALKRGGRPTLPTCGLLGPERASSG